MKPRLFFTLFVLILSSNSFSQSLIFCESVDKYGHEINPADTFDISWQGGTLCVLLKTGHTLNTDSVNLEIYDVDSAGEAVLNGKITIDVQKNWLFCWKKLLFKDDGRYKINAYSAENILLGTGELFIRKEK